MVSALDQIEGPTSMFPGITLMDPALTPMVSPLSENKKITIEEKRAVIPEEMNCVICQELMSVPTAAIPCMHTFC